MQTRSMYRLIAMFGVAALASGCNLLNIGGGGRVDVPFLDVKVEDDLFSPDTVKIVPGQAVRWLWEGENLHNVTWDPAYGTPEQNSPTQKVGDLYRQFDELGLYPYRCTVHPGMIAWVKVIPFIVPELPL